MRRRRRGERESSRKFRRAFRICGICIIEKRGGGQLPMLVRAADLKADLWASRFGQSKRKCRVDSSASLQLHKGDAALPIRWR